MTPLILLITFLFPMPDLSPAASIAEPASAMRIPRAHAQSDDRELSVTASFSDQHAVQTSEPIELLLSRPLKASDERLGILIGNTDVSSLFSGVNLRLRYDAKLWPLPLGESTVTIFLISKTDEWKELERFTLVVEQERASSRERSRLAASDDLEARFIKTNYFDRLASMLAPTLTVTEAGSGRQEPAEPSPKPSSKKRKIKFVPSITFGLKPRPVTSAFPASNMAEQPSASFDLTSPLESDVTYGSFSSHSTADFAGHSFQPETLRYDALSNAAPKVDLSSYLFQFQTGPVKYEVGHVSFGAQRHLINSFSSRGIKVTVPFLKRFDFSAAAMNGTSIVGYSNFFGLNRRKHQMLGGTLGVELLAERPGGLRLEVGVMGGQVLPLSSVSGDGIRDQTRSRGFSVRMIASDKAGRFHLDGGFSRSFSIYPNPDETVVDTPGLASNAHYLEVSYKILNDFALSTTRKANLTVSFIEEKVAPNFRSLGASPEADKIRYGVLLEGSVGEITGTFSYRGDHNNLNKVLTKRSRNGDLSLSLAAPAKALIGRTKDSPWLPALSYGFARNHGFDVAIPINGGFEETLNEFSNVFTIRHSFKAGWQPKKFTIDYAFDRSLVDNQQLGHELNDLTTAVNTGTFGFALNSKLNLRLNLRADSAGNRGDDTIQRTYALGPGITWNPTSQMTVTGDLSNTIVGNAANLTHTRQTNFDAAWSYGFNVGKQELKKLSAKFSVRYSNGYSLARIIATDTVNKNQALITSMSFTLF
jgi:hypothetical protein